MRPFTLASLAVVAAAFVMPPVQARPVYGGGVVVAPGWGYGGAWVGGPYRPWGPGYAGWRWGYPGYGWGYGWGAGWAFGAGYPWYWGAPAVYGTFAAPAYWPYGALTTTAPVFDVQVPQTYVQQAPAPTPAPAPAATTPSAPDPSAGHWYYYTEPAGYYPYVSKCTRPWIAVTPKNQDRP